MEDRRQGVLKADWKSTGDVDSEGRKAKPKGTTIKHKKTNKLNLMKINEFLWIVH